MVVQEDSRQSNSFTPIASLSGIQMRLGYHPIIKHEIERLYTSVFAIRTNSSGALGVVR